VTERADDRAGVAVRGDAARERLSNEGTAGETISP
jgi:hypothetical protein